MSWDWDLLKPKPTAMMDAKLIAKLDVPCFFS
jgi:hypothetical protein